MELLRKVSSPIIIILFFFLSLFAYTKLAGPIPFDITSITTQKSDAFSVSGEGKVQAIPDSATVRLGVTSSAPTADQAKLKMNEAINKVTQAIKALGVDEKNIKTENFNVYPNYDNTRPLIAPAVGEPTPVKDLNPQVSSYSGNTNLVVTVPTADLANKIIDTGTINGANQVGGVDFQVKDKETALNQAREIAVKNAKKKAEDAARVAGFRLGNLINYSESQDGIYPRAMMSAAADKAQGGAVTEVQPGTNEISVTVTLSYEIK